MPGSTGQGGLPVRAVFPEEGGIYIPVCSQISLPEEGKSGLNQFVPLFIPNLSIRVAIYLCRYRVNKWVERSRGVFRETTFIQKSEVR